MKIQTTSIFGFALLTLVAFLPVTQAQVYLPGTSNTDNPPNNIDPDLLNGYTEEGVASRSSGEVHCGNANNSCVGGLLNRFANPRVVEAADATSSPLMVFDWEIRAAQPPDSTDLTAFLDGDGPANFLEKAQLNMYFNTEAFPLPVRTGVNTADHWGPSCTVARGEIMEALAVFGPADSYAAGGADSLQLALDNSVSINRFSVGGPQEMLLETFFIPHDRYEQVATISCPVGSVRDKPAKIAFQAKMMRGAGQRTANANSRASAPDAIEFYANIAANNLWYYPLDNSPAIVNAELGVAGGGLSHIDLTFSEPIADADSINPDVFSNTTIGIGSISDFNTGEAAGITGITVTAVVPLSTTVLRLSFGQDLREVAAGLSSNAPYFVFVVPPAAGITDEDGNPLHTGDDWRLAVFFDHEAPYVAEATVGIESQRVELVFNEPVQFGVVFDDSRPATAQAYEELRAGSSPEPSTEDFTIIYYRDDGTTDEFSPAGVKWQLADPSTSAITAVTLIMPTDQDYLSTETIDIRIAQRMKDLTYPSLASVFDVVGSDTQYKTSKFGVGPSNFPRTVASAQAGSLQLRGREYELIASLADESTMVDTGGSARVAFTLRGLSELQAGETITASLPQSSTVTYVPPSITFSSDSTEMTVTMVIASTALDSSMQGSELYPITPEFETEQGRVRVLRSQESETRVTINRIFRVEMAAPSDLQLRGLSTQVITIGMSGTGASLQLGEQIVFDVLLSLDSQFNAYTDGVELSAGNSGAVRGLAGVDGALEVTLTSEQPQASFEVSVTDISLRQTDLRLLGQFSSAGSFMQQFDYAGDNEECRESAPGCIGTVNAVGGPEFDLIASFNNGSTQVEVFAGDSAELTFTLRGDSFNELQQEESVTISLPENPGVLSYSESEFTFQGESTEVTVTIEVAKTALDGQAEDASYELMLSPMLVNKQGVSEVSLDKAVVAMEILPRRGVKLKLRAFLQGPLQ